MGREIIKKTIEIKIGLMRITTTKTKVDKSLEAVIIDLIKEVTTVLIILAKSIM